MTRFTKRHSKRHTHSYHGRLMLTWLGLVLFSASLWHAARALGEESSAELPSSSSAPVDFNREIRPILSITCFPCHGQDSDAREADLRLDRSTDAYAAEAFVPGKPEQSIAIERIFSEDDGERMPPVDAAKQLTPTQRHLLRQWVQEGARYTEHWAFAAPMKPPVPKHRFGNWQRNVIDAFVARRLEQEGLAPSPEANRYTLARRLYLDLIGLPPSVEEADAFVRDNRSDAYDRLVDRLLASPRYGERWARRWLDLARYSDTNGYEKDRPRTMWPYRDWVIRAFNRDMPFDQFTIEQIAGDMLPDATIEQRIATGFQRNTMINEEGGIDPEEFRFLAQVDRMATMGTTWLGLTIGCAQCHTHKYDPISQTEYYQMMAMVNNANEVTLEVPIPDIVARRKKIAQQIAKIEEHLADAFPLSPQDDAVEDSSEDSDRADTQRRSRYLQERFAQWQSDEAARAVDWLVLTPAAVASNLASLDILDDGSILASGDQTKNDTFILTLVPGIPHVTAIRLEVLPHHSLPQKGPGRRVVGQGANAGVGDFFLSRFTASLTGDATDQPVPLELCNATESFAAKDRAAALAIDDHGDTGWSIAGRPGERHVAVFPLKTPQDFDGNQQLLIRLEHESFYPSGLGRFRISVTGATGTIKATPLPETVEQALLLAPEDRTLEQQQQLMRYFLSVAPELAEEHRKIKALREKMPPLPETLVMQERPQRHARQTRRHHRGEFLSPKEVVTPGVPAALHPLPEGSAANRLALARWIVDPNNPLTARVLVNRHWQAFFGTGLVRTTEDLGTQGELPSHPELLDWLAVEFMQRGWSIKSLHRLLVTSATYRQASQVSPELLRRDPENRLLARGPRFRLDAELIRDTILRASGQLSSKIGGPSVFPVQPPGITEASYGPLTWTVSTGEDRYRRGLYTFNKRTAPYVAFGLFDAPSGEACIARRVNSNTPLQALNLLNDPVVLDAARAMARGEMQHSDAGQRTAQEVAMALFRRCVTRRATAQEVSALVSYFNDLRNSFRANQDPLPIVGSGNVYAADFSANMSGWIARHDCKLTLVDGNLQVISTGNDPFLSVPTKGPAGEYRLRIRAHFGVEGKGQVFWTTEKDQAEAAERSASFDLVANQWHSYEIPLTFDAPITSLRLDPGAIPGTSMIESVQLQYGTTDVPVDVKLDNAKLAAWTLVARVLLNLDETITKP